MERISNALNRAANNNGLINVLLVGCFGLLSVRSLKQQKDIEALEAHRNTLLNDNKSMKAVIWNSKQQLYADATSNSQDSVVPLSKLKTIYGESAVSPSLFCEYSVSFYTMPARCLLKVLPAILFLFVTNVVVCFLSCFV